MLVKGALYCEIDINSEDAIEVFEALQVLKEKYNKILKEKDNNKIKVK